MRVEKNKKPELSEAVDCCRGAAGPISQENFISELPRGKRQSVLSVQFLKFTLNSRKNMLTCLITPNDVLP